MDDGWLAAEPGIRRDEPLDRHSQYGIGGPADWYLRVRDAAHLAGLMRRCHEAGCRSPSSAPAATAWCWTAASAGWWSSCPAAGSAGSPTSVIELPGGAMMPRAALDCAAQGLGGLEFGIGVPGTCGASVRGNAGAFGTEIKDVLVDCDTLAPDGSQHTFAAAELGFAYRNSRLKHDLAGHVVVAARLRVHEDLPVAVRALTDAIQAERRATQPYDAAQPGQHVHQPPG